MGNCLSPHEFEGFTNLLDQRVGASWTRTGLVEALLAPDTGLVDRWGLELVRDNYEFCLLREAGTNRGVGIEYGKNLLGVTCTTDVSGACARIVPVGKTSKGKDLLLTAGTYDINGTTVVVGPGETWVTSPQAGDYPAPMMTDIDTGVKAKSGKAADLLTARRRMIEAALNQFADTACDQPSLNLRWILWPWAIPWEYAQYRRLEDVYLCDRVRVRHPGIGLDVLTEVIEVTWDCLTGRYKSIELGRVQLDRLRVKLPHWQLPQGIPGTIILPDTMDGGRSWMDSDGQPDRARSRDRVGDCAGSRDGRKDCRRGHSGPAHRVQDNHGGTDCGRYDYCESGILTLAQLNRANSRRIDYRRKNSRVNGK
jgi:hypothetical protein